MDAHKLTRETMDMSDAEYDALCLEPVWGVIEESSGKVLASGLTYLDALAKLNGFSESGAVAGWMHLAYAPTPAPAIERHHLDWLCIAHRAIEQAPTNDILWLEAVNSMRGLIVAFNREARDDQHAAHAQYLLNRLAALAVTPAGAPTTGTPVPVYSERVKDQLMHIATGGYDGRSLL
jgi:hypothetical protein